MAKHYHKPGVKETRLSGGEFGGRRLKGGPGIRPTPAVVREAMFSILGPWLHGARILDLFAGTGAVSLEAIGRGAAEAVLVDAAHTSVLAERANIAALGLEDKVQIIEGDALRVLDSGRLGDQRFDLIFVGPPYDRNFCAPTLERIREDLLLPDGLVIVQASRWEHLEDAIGCLRRTQLRDYGDSILHFYGVG